MRTVNMHEAKTHLSRLVERAAKGEGFIIAKAGKPLVKVVPLSSRDEAAPRSVVHTSASPLHAKARTCASRVEGFEQLRAFQARLEAPTRLMNDAVGRHKRRRTLRLHDRTGASSEYDRDQNCGVPLIPGRNVHKYGFMDIRSLVRQ